MEVTKGSDITYALETRPDSPVEPGMQPRDPCLPWRGILPINSTGKELKYTFLFLLTPLLLRGNMTSCQHLCNDRARRYQFGSLISHENLQDETSFLIVIFCCDESPGGKGAFIVCSLRAEVCDASLCAFRGRLIDPSIFMVHSPCLGKSASSAKTRGFHTQLDGGPETP